MVYNFDVPFSVCLELEEYLLQMIGSLPSYHKIYFIPKVAGSTSITSPLSNKILSSINVCI